MSDWWQAIEDELDARSEQGPDPWAGALVDEPLDLTDDQQRFLASLADQPEIPRIDFDGDHDFGHDFGDEPEAGGAND